MIFACDNFVFLSIKYPLYSLCCHLYFIWINLLMLYFNYFSQKLLSKINLLLPSKRNSVWFKRLVQVILVCINGGINYQIIFLIGFKKKKKLKYFEV